ncbi:MAG TPA: proline dehydrogenase family protein [Solirubrobacteraceae bacterium]|jgi:RHH-type proline utilization regulon transcriptional repressor/proline dehydrogenase/delta 1-pyrroline-5-carboxylate dehydrogenase|nr:proline dehydrogenase family protein [Solirubrobacteraceae bacterium]
MAAQPDPDDLEAEIQEIGRALDAARPHGRPSLQRAQDGALEWASRRRGLQAALLRLVDVAPACTDDHDLADHLRALLGEVDHGPLLLRGGVRLPDAVLGRAAAGVVRHMAARFIVGGDPSAAAGELERMWRAGQASTLDLLGEATVTEAEGDQYAERCAEALRTVSAVARGWPGNPRLERDATGREVPRADLSIKLSALTPVLRAQAPERARAAKPRLRSLLRLAADRGAHVQIDAESYDTREAAFALALETIAEDEFRNGPSAGVVVQAYLRDSAAILDHILDRAGAMHRSTALAVRLVKGAYWDAETAQAAQHGWTPPVFSDKADTDRSFESLTSRLIEARGTVRPLIASHNLRSIAHAIAVSRRAGAEHDVEFQVLRGLGDDLAVALAGHDLRVRVYCPVGDLVAGMAYLVRRLLENTSNDSFLHHAAAGDALDDLLRAP